MSLYRRSRMISTIVITLLLTTLLLGNPLVGHESAKAAASGTVVQNWQTSQAGDRLTAQNDLTFSADSGVDLPTIEITPSRYYQAMDGFGGAFTEAGWQVLSTLSSSARDEVLAALFNPTTGAGFSLTRTAIGSNDFAMSHYTYDDLSGGTDFDMAQFSIDHDLQYLIPYIQAAKSQGNFRIYASPWSAPAWMKTNDSLFNGGSVIPPSTDSRYYEAYALYFQKYIEAYAQNGIPIEFVSVQNEPQYTALFESTNWSSSDMANFVSNYLGPRFANNNITTRIRIFEHNRDLWQFPKQVLDNADTAPYVAGVNFHNYECLTYCMPDNIALFAASHPGYSMWMGEHTTIETAPDPSDYLDGERWGNEIMTDLLNGEGGWIFWNMVLDQNGGPYSEFSGAQDSLVEVDTSNGTVCYLPKYWYLAHFSKFVQPGAYRIGADGGQLQDGLTFIAFKNPDGSEVLEVINANSSSIQIKVREDGNIFTPTLAPHSINTFKWDAPINTYHIIAGGSGSWNSIASDNFSADAFFTGGGIASNVFPIDNTADDPLYQPERNGNFSYSFPVPNGQYQVTLKFAENYWNCSNCRKFDVSIGGTQVLSGYDIYAETGAKYKAIDKSFTTTVSNGNLTIGFSTVIDNAKVDAIAIVPLPDEGESFTTILSPGLMMAQDYNKGGEGVAFHFSNPNGTDTSYRTDAVNLETCSNADHCGDDLGWLSDGDWVNYTVNVAVGGNYDLFFLVANPNSGGKFAMDMDGAPFITTQTVPNTGGWQTWSSVPVYGVKLSKGVHTFKFRVVTGGFNFHYAFFQKVHLLDVLPTTIEAEWYAGGGEGAGYHDTTTGNYFTNPYPGYYRPEDVDIEISSEPSYDVGQIADGEWLRYEVWSPTARSYTLNFRVASSYTTGKIRVDLDSVGNTLGSTLSVPNTGGWQTWQNISETVSLPSGTHTLYVYFPKGGFNFSSLTFN